MIIENEYKFVDISQINTLVNGDVSNYLNYYWVTKNGSVLLNKRFQNFLCNKNKSIVEMLIKDCDIQDYEILQIPIICVNDHKIKKLINDNGVF